MRSVASFAALTASVLGMIKSAFANSAMASCSLESRVVAKVSKKMESAASTAPPPAKQSHGLLVTNGAQNAVVSCLPIVLNQMRFMQWRIWLSNLSDKLVIHT